MRRFTRSRWSLVAFATGLVVLLSGCGDKPMDTLAPAGPNASRINELFWIVTAIAIVILVLVAGAYAWIAIKFRAKPPEDGEQGIAGPYADEEFPTQIHGNTKLEIAWTLVPTAILAFVAVLTLSVLFDIFGEAEAAEGELAVTVVGNQWWWEFHYHLNGDLDAPPDFVTSNELYIPVDYEVPLRITARDVIHSFWIPRLNGKRDAVPGRNHPWKIEADRTGWYQGVCTEFCGLSHAYMRKWVIAMERDEWEEWVAGQLLEREPLAEGEPGYPGEQIFLARCASCHPVNGVTQRDRDGDGQLVTDDWSLYVPDPDTRFTVAQFIPGSVHKSGAAPNLTHFASRNHYAGAIFELYDEDGNVNRAQLEAWLRNPPAEKPAFADDQRGMPNLGLSEQEIDHLVDYLLVLD